MRRRSVLFFVGVTVCLVGSLLMGWGESVLGENHAGIATVIGIVGIGIITRTRKEMENIS